jgi:hypothetical protein
VGILKIVLGVLLLLIAVKQWRGRPRGEDEPQLPAWMKTIDTFTPLKSAGMVVRDHRREADRRCDHRAGGLNAVARGDDRTRTGVNGFAGRWIAALPRRQEDRKVSVRAEAAPNGWRSQMVSSTALPLGSRTRVAPSAAGSDSIPAASMRAITSASAVSLPSLSS